MSHTFCELINKSFIFYMFTTTLFYWISIAKLNEKITLHILITQVLIVLYFSWKFIVSIKYVYYVKLKTINNIFSDFSEEISNSKHVQSNLSNMLVIICIYQTKTTGSVANQHFRYFGKIASIKCKLVKI